MLRVKNLTFGFDEKKILDNVSFEIEEGMLYGLFGPNGCGKSTLFKCCLSFLDYEKGTVHINGVNAKEKGIGEMARSVGYVPQEHRPPFPYPVREVVLMGRTPHMRGAFRISLEDRMKADAALELLGIGDIAERPYNQLSGGQRQLVLIARAVAQDTPLMLLDEPTSALDFSNQIRVWRILRRIVDTGRTIIACTHDPNHVSWFCDRVLVQTGKGIIAHGSPEEVLNEKTLESMYGKVCGTGSMDGLRMVYPREVN